MSSEHFPDNVDMPDIPDDWVHITKIDPEMGKDLPLLYPLYLQHTDALEIGGSKDVTAENMEKTMDLVADRPTVAFQEPSGATQVTKVTVGLSEFLVAPIVMNGDYKRYASVVGAGLDYIRSGLDPDVIDAVLNNTVPEAYIVMNPDSAAADETWVTEDDLVTPEEAKEFAQDAVNQFNSGIIYLEYSGTYGGEEAEEILEAIREGVSQPRIFYGGGLENREDAVKVIEAGADSVVVGNIFHEIASEQQEFCDRALEELGVDASSSDIEEWVEETIDIADTSATSYLLTNPFVENPENLAREYLQLTVETYLALVGLRMELDDEQSLTDEDLRARVNEWENFPAESELMDALPDYDADHPRNLVYGLFADQFDLQTEYLPVEHLGIDLN